MSEQSKAEDVIMVIMAFPVALVMMIRSFVKRWWQDLKDDIRDGDY